MILGDLAAVEAAHGDPEAACQYAEQALDQLTRTWYATGMDRLLEVRKALQQWAGDECVQRLDDRLYGWQTTLSAMPHGPRRISAVFIPACEAGRMSLSRRSPTYKV